MMTPMPVGVNYHVQVILASEHSEIKIMSTRYGYGESKSTICSVMLPTINEAELVQISSKKQALELLANKMQGVDITTVGSISENNLKYRLCQWFVEHEARHGRKNQASYWRGASDTFTDLSQLKARVSSQMTDLYNRMRRGRIRRGRSSGMKNMDTPLLGQQQSDQDMLRARPRPW
jgi:hypothetical protein